MTRSVRTSTKAIIIQNDRLLFTKNEDHDGVFYMLPGGGQNWGETLHNALHRECREEISAEVCIGPLRHIREYIGRNHEFAEWDVHFHQVEFLFECTLAEGSEPSNGTVPDETQIGVEWLEIARLHEYRIYPSIIKDLLGGRNDADHPVYLGDVN